MKSISRMFPLVAAGALAAALALPSPVQAQGAPREGSVEFILPLIYTSSTSFNGQGGSSADINANLGFGFGINYNLNNHFQIGGLFNWSSRNYQATLVDSTGASQKATGYLESSTIGVNATYFLMQGGFTPYLTAGLGSTFIDTNVPNGLPSTGCWYDPFYGQVCSTYVPTKTQTAVSYTAGAGVRFEMTRSVAVQGSYNKIWIDYSNSNPTFDAWRLDFVFRM